MKLLYFWSACIGVSFYILKINFQFQITSSHKKNERTKILTSCNLNLHSVIKHDKKIERKSFSTEKFFSINRRLINWLYACEFGKWTGVEHCWLTKEVFISCNDFQQSYNGVSPDALTKSQDLIINYIIEVTPDNVQSAKKLFLQLELLKRKKIAVGHSIVLLCEDESMINGLRSLFDTILTPYCFEDIFPNIISFKPYSTEDLLSIFKICTSNYYDISVEASNYFVDIFNSFIKNGILITDKDIVKMANIAIDNVSVRIKKVYENNPGILADKSYLKLELDDIKKASDSIFKLKQKTMNTNFVDSKNVEIHEYKNSKSYIDLMNLIGLDNVKTTIDNIIVGYQVSNLRRNTESSFCPKMNMCLIGNPGTAKTTVARLFYKILKKIGRVTGKLIEVNRGDLVGKYAGSSDELIKKSIFEARHGVLFVDEAYSLVEKWADGGRGHGGQVIDAIASEMSSGNNDVMFIFAGYPNEMENFINDNQTIKSNLQYTLSFEDYSPNQLYDIFMLKANKEGYSVSKKAKKAIKSICTLVFSQHNYGNGRFVNNLFDQSVSNSFVRASKENLGIERTNSIVFEDLDVPLLDSFGIDIHNKKMSASNQLDNLVGLIDVKQEIKKIISNNIIDKRRSDAREDYQVSQTLHMVFNGNPGTAKTTVARLFAEVLRENNVQSGRFIECSYSGSKTETRKVKS